MRTTACSARSSRAITDGSGRLRAGPAWRSRASVAPALTPLEDDERDLALGALLVLGVAAVVVDDPRPQAAPLLGSRDAGVDRLVLAAYLHDGVWVRLQVVEPGGGLPQARL